MASWMTYARKVLTSVAGELEKTAQEFNDAIHSLSVPKASDAAESEISDGYESPQYSTAKYPQNPDSLEAGSIPEYLRGVGSSSTQRSKDRPQTSIQYCDSNFTAESRILHLPSSRTAVETKPVKTTKTKGHRPSFSQSQLQIDCSSSSPSIATTATTRQPEPLGAFSCQSHPLQSIHKRLSQSSPSLSPVSHERDGTISPDVTDSYIEDLDSLPYDICETDPLRFRTNNTRLYHEEHVKSLPLSVSTPCLVHMQRILPSCIKNLNCPSSSFSPQQAYSYRDKSSLKSSSCRRNIYSNFESDENRTGGGINLQRSATFGNSKQCSPSLGSKRPGKVVMVVSQPHSCQETEGVLKEKLLSFETKERSALPDCLKSEVAGVQSSLRESDRIARTQGLPSDTHGQQAENLFQTAKPSLKIERQMQQTHWRMLAPLARVLTFAYSQVVNAMFLLQNDESSISSGSNRSRASSFSKDISGSHSSSPSKFFNKANSDTLQPVSNLSNSRHKRQMSQISLAGSALSSDSFEVLDVSEMESSNFVYVGTDPSDILHEYHLFPSKPTLFTQSECTTSVSHSGAKFTTPFPVYSLGTEEINLMSSSSADFAHFDFRDLISNRQDNKLNPLVSAGEGATARKISVPSETCGVQNESSGFVNDAMLQSFVVLERNRSPMLVCNSGLDDSTPVQSMNGPEGLHSRSESQSSFSVVSENEFQMKV